jgi:hypothetical protein
MITSEEHRDLIGLLELRPSNQQKVYDVDPRAVLTGDVQRGVPLLLREEDE